MSSRKFKTLDGFNSTGDVRVGEDVLVVNVNTERVGINKQNPQTPLDVNGTITATAFSGNGASISSVDASQLGGVAASGYLRSNAATTYSGSGTLTFNSTGTFRIQSGQIRLDNDRPVRFGTVNSPGVSMQFNSANNTLMVEGSNTAFIGSGGTFFRRAGNQQGIRILPSATTNTNTLTITTASLTGDRTITLPNATGTVALTSDLPTVGNGQLTVSGSTGLSGSGTFTANQTTNTSISLTNTDRGSAQNIFKNIANAAGANQFSATTNSSTIRFAGSGSTSVTFGTNNTVTFSSPVFSEISVNDIQNTGHTGASFITGRRFQAGLDSNRSVSGSWTFSGTVSAADLNSTSDRSLKTNIQPIECALEKVMALSGVSFDWKESGDSSIGLIAQDVEKIVPEVVSDDGKIKRISYGNLVGLLIEAIHDQQKQIEELKLIINNN